MMTIQDWALGLYPWRAMFLDQRVQEPPTPPAAAHYDNDGLQAIANLVAAERWLGYCVLTGGDHAKAIGSLVRAHRCWRMRESGRPTHTEQMRVWFELRW